MKNVVISESLFKAMMEQLGYWADYCDDSEGHLAGIIERAEEAANSTEHVALLREDAKLISGDYETMLMHVSGGASEVDKEILARLKELKLV